MSHKKLSKEKIINAFLFSSFDKSAGATSLQDISDVRQIKKASLYNHFSSRDEMYFATLEYCRENLNALNFIPDEIRLSGKLGQESLSLTLKKILKRYINLYETEPLFQIYSFINSEKFFNSLASKIADKEYEKILGKEVEKLVVPVKPGRNTAMIVEVAAMNYRQRGMGYDAAIEFTKKLSQTIQQ